MKIAPTIKDQLRTVSFFIKIFAIQTVPYHLIMDIRNNFKSHIDMFEFSCINYPIKLSYLQNIASFSDSKFTSSNNFPPLV